MFINAVIHILPTIAMRRYAPGVVSAILLYLPLSVGAYYLAAQGGQLTLAEGVGAGLLGAFWMAIPVAFQLVRLLVTRTREPGA